MRSSAREEKLSVVSGGEIEVRSLDHSLQLLIFHSMLNRETIVAIKACSWNSFVIKMRINLTKGGPAES